MACAFCRIVIRLPGTFAYSSSTGASSLKSDFFPAVFFAHIKNLLSFCDAYKIKHIIIILGQAVKINL